MALSKERWIHHKELGKPPKSRALKLVKPKTKSSKTKHKSYEIELNSKPRREQGGLGQLSQSVSIQKLKKPYLESYHREEKGGTRKEEERGAGTGEVACCPGKRREREGEGVRGYLTPTTLKPKD